MAQLAQLARQAASTRPVRRAMPWPDRAVRPGQPARPAVRGGWARPVTLALLSAALPALPVLLVLPARKARWVRQARAAPALMAMQAQPGPPAQKARAAQPERRVHEVPR